MQLVVTGTNFVTNSSINFGNTTLTPITASTSTSLTATIPTSALASAAVINVTVTNPPPGGGTSNAVEFDLQDYAFGTISPNVVTIKAGATAQFTIPIIALNGFSAELTPACGTGLPAQATCTFNPTPVTPTADGVSEMLSISTVSNGALPPASLPRRECRYRAGYGLGWPRLW